MPTNTFFKLPKNRQTEIINAAKEEFSHYIYEEASINRIIKSINMCRGTFYLYFENKEDLYFYILSLMHEKAKTTIEEISTEENKDIKKMLIAIFDYITNKDITKIKPLINNIFINFNTKHVEKVMPLEIGKKHKILNYFNFSEYNIDDEEKFILLHILETMLVQNIGIAFRNINKLETIRTLYIKEIDLILNGIERRNL